MKKKMLHTNLVTTFKVLARVVPLLSVPLLLTAALLMAACSSDDSSDTSTSASVNTEIGFTTNTTTWHDGTRATTFDNDAALQGETGGFTCYAYTAGTTDSYINGSNVKYVDSEWKFQDGKHYWPTSGSLDFFAYMPATKPDYISSITYAVNDDPAPRPYFVCADLPMTYQNAYTDELSVEHDETGQGSAMKEFIYALTTGQNKADQGATGVTMTFQHPFARIKFQLSASHPDITINKITFKNLKTGGKCTFDGSTSTWSSLTPAEGSSNFVMTLKGTGAEFNSNPDSPRQIGTNFIMVPQTFSGAVEVKATWSDWGVDIEHTVSTTLSSTTWEAGTSYTYTFTITETDLIVSSSKYTEQW